MSKTTFDGRETQFYGAISYDGRDVLVLDNIALQCNHRILFNVLVVKWNKKLITPMTHQQLRPPGARGGIQVQGPRDHGPFQHAAPEGNGETVAHGPARGSNGNAEMRPGRGGKPGQVRRR